MHSIPKFAFIRPSVVKQISTQSTRVTNVYVLFPPPLSLYLSTLQSRMLVLEHGLLRIIVSTLLDILTPCKDPITGILKLRSSNYKHSRVFYIMYDLRYVHVCILCWVCSVHIELCRLCFPIDIIFFCYSKGEIVNLF